MPLRIPELGRIIFTEDLIRVEQRRAQTQDRVVQTHELKHPLIAIHGVNLIENIFKQFRERHARLRHGNSPRSLGQQWVRLEPQHPHHDAIQFSVIQTDANSASIG